MSENSGNFGVSGAVQEWKSPVAPQITSTPMDPRDIPPLPERLKKKLALAYRFIQAAKLSGDGDKRRLSLKYAEDAKRTCDRWRCNERFVYFVKTVRPELYISRHHRVMGAKFERIREGSLKRLMVMMPPGCSKSLFCSVLLPAWLYGQRPSGRVLEASHSKDLVEDFGRDIKDLIAEPAYQRIYPGLVLRADVKAAGRWHTTQGGRFQAIGVGGRAAGRRADLLAVIDDPISEQEAYSEGQRKRSVEWYPRGFRTRNIAGMPHRLGHDPLAPCRSRRRATVADAERQERGTVGSHQVQGHP